MSRKMSRIKALQLALDAMSTASVQTEEASQAMDVISDMLSKLLIYDKMRKRRRNMEKRFTDRGNLNED